MVSMGSPFFQPGGTRAAKSSPRAAYEVYQSKLAHPGDRITASPGRARRAAAAHRLGHVAAVSTGTRPEKALGHLTCRLPYRDHAPDRRHHLAQRLQVETLVAPPAMSTTEAKPATAARTDAGVVALESSYQVTPSAVGHLR